jgi:ribonuclease-3
MKALIALQEQIGHIFTNKNCLKQALFHPSLDPVKGQHFERLEFLGDRVLGLHMAQLLYELYPQEPEGSLAKRFVSLVRKETLADIGQKWAVESVLKTQKGGIAKSIIADTVEALLGAIHLENPQAAATIIRTHWMPFMQTDAPTDARSAIQEWAQDQFGDPPIYHLQESTGPAHNPTFIMVITLPNKTTYTACGTSKKDAAQKAAQKALDANQRKIKT